MRCLILSLHGALDSFSRITSRTRPSPALIAESCARRMSPLALIARGTRLPVRAYRLCACGAIVQGRCSACAAKRQPWAGNRPTAYQRGYNSAYRSARIETLKRDPICTMCGMAPSTQADHIVPLSRGGSNEAGNLRGVCARCNHKAGASLGGRA